MRDHSVAPLLEQRFAVDEDQGGRGVPGDDGTPDHRFARAGLGHEHPEVVAGEGVGGGSLFGRQDGSEGDIDRLGRSEGVNDAEGASGFGDD